MPQKRHYNKELPETNTKKVDKIAEINKLPTKMDQMSAQLKGEVAALQNALTEFTAGEDEMDILRCSCEAGTEGAHRILCKRQPMK